MPDPHNSREGDDPKMPREFGADVERAVAEIVSSQMLWRGNGPLWSPQPDTEATAVSRFEDAFAAWLGVPFAHAVNSGTSANEAAIAGLGLPPRSEVLCPAASPVFVPMAVLAAGCIPVFVDVDPATMLIDPQRIAAAVTESTRAIVVVHLWGYPAPMAEILEAARSHRLLVVEDCAQAPASLFEGRRVGTFGDVSCFSLQQSKLISAGEGGVVATDNLGTYARSVLYSNTGIPSFRHGITLADVGSDRVGIQSYGHNHRMSELQGVVALTQLRRVNDLVAGRARAVAHLRNAVRELSGGDIAPLEPPAGSHVSHWRLPVRGPSGFGDYEGIPALEPVFRVMEKQRRTPFGVELPSYVHYGGDGVQGAVEGAGRVRVLAVHPFMSMDAARAAVRTRLALT